MAENNEEKCSNLSRLGQYLEFLAFLNNTNSIPRELFLFSGVNTVNVEKGNRIVKSLIMVYVSEYGKHPQNFEYSQSHPNKIGLRCLYLQS